MGCLVRLAARSSLHEWKDSVVTLGLPSLRYPRERLQHLRLHNRAGAISSGYAKRKQGDLMAVLTAPWLKSHRLAVEIAGTINCTGLHNETFSGAAANSAKANVRY